MTHLGRGENKASELDSVMKNKSDKTIREWRTHLFKNEGEIPECSQGKYQCSGIVWSCEDFNRKATQYIQLNANVKGKPNLTIRKFLQLGS